MQYYILDSDHLSLHQRGFEPLKQKLLSLQPDKLGISIVSVEELLRGRLAQIRRAGAAEKRVQAYFWMHKTIDYICAFHIIAYDANAEKWYRALRDQKIRIGTNDLKIAAIALSHNAVLATRNKKDFSKIPDLEIEDWSTF